MRAGQWGGQREGGFAHAQVQAVNTYRLTPRSLAYPLCGLGNKCILVTLRSIPSDVITGHGDSVHPAVSPRLCWSWYHKAGQLWSSKSSGGGGGALLPSEFLPSPPGADVKWRTQTTG